LAIVLVLATAGAALGQTQAQVKQGTVEHIKVHGKSLDGNLEKDSPDRDVFICLPPEYATNTTKRYPVEYLLHGYGLTAERWTPFTKMAEASDKNIAAGTMKGMILVNPDAYTIYNGSMYSSSVTIGDWESFNADDLVSYVDSHYRTIANRDSRSLGGHSMGGYGTIRIGMKRPDVLRQELQVLSDRVQRPALLRRRLALPRRQGQGIAEAAEVDLQIRLRQKLRRGPRTRTMLPSFSTSL
jgi:enterochelin esterase-like enzyme